MSDTAPTPDSDPQIQQNVRGDRNQAIGKILGGIVVYVSVGQAIINHVSEEIESSETKPTKPDIGPNPYRGLLAFHESDGDLFFGRDPQIQELWEKFRTLHEEESETRLLTIYGPSGSGKSSLARAGLIPALGKRPLPGRDLARVAVLVPGSHPLEALATVLARIATEDATPVAKTREFAAELKAVNSEGIYDGLRRIADTLPEIAIKPLIVLVDQLEEVFTLCEDLAERDAFIGNLFCAATERSKRVSAIVTIRSDFLGATQKYPRLNQLISSQGFFVAAMSEEGLREAIAKPAEMAGHPLYLSTVDLLIEQTEGREGALPLLQFALTQIWKGLAEGKEAAETLRAIGGVSGALAHYADESYGKLSLEKQERVRRIFIQLVRPGDTADTRRLATKAEVGEENWALVKKLADDRLVVTSRIEGTQVVTVEVVHEALIYNWGELRSWIKTDRVFREWQERLRSAMAQWQKTEKDESSLLRGVTLAEAEDWLKNRSEELIGELKFITASVKLRDREKEKLLRQRKRTIIGLTSGLVGALGLASIAGMGWWQANIAQTDAELKSLVAESEKLLLSYDKLSVKLKYGESPYDKAKGKSNAYKTLFDIRKEALILAIEAAKKMKYSIGVKRETRFQVLSLVGNVIYKKNDSPGVVDIDTSECLPSRTPVSYHFSSEGAFICTNYDGTVKFWNRNLGVKLKVFKGDSDWIGDTQFSPDNQIIATGNVDGTLLLWNRFTGKIVKSLKEESLSATSSICFSPNGKLIASGNLRGSVTIWDVSTGHVLRTLDGLSVEVEQLSFSRNGKVIIAKNRENAVKAWDVETGKIIEALQGEIHVSSDSHTLLSISHNPNNDTIFTTKDLSTMKVKEARNTEIFNFGNFSPDGRTFAANNGGMITLWNIPKNKKIKTLQGYSANYSQASFNSNGKMIATSSKDNTTLKLWDVSSGKILKSIRVLKNDEVSVKEDFTSGFRSFFSPNNKIIATISNNRELKNVLKVWEVSTGKELKNISRQIYVYMGGENQDIRFSPDSQMISAVADDGTVKIWNLSSGKELKKPREPALKQGSSVIFGQKGNIYAIGNSNGIITVKDSKTGSDLVYLKGHNGQINDVSISPDGKKVISGGADNSARIWDSKSGQQINLIKPHSGEITSVSFNLDGKIIAVAGSDDIVTIWNVSNGEKLFALKGQSKEIIRVGFTKDSKLIYAKNRDGTVESWEMLSGKEADDFKKLPKILSSDFRYQEDDKQLFTVNWDGRVKLWDVSTGKLIKELKESFPFSTSLSISKDSKILAAATTENTIELWDIETGNFIRTIKFKSVNNTNKSYHDSLKNLLLFSPDNKIIGTINGNSMVELWNVTSGERINTLDQYSKSVNAIAFSPDSKSVAFASKDGTVKSYNILTGEKILNFSQSSDEIMDVAFSSDGKILASTSIGGLTLWDVDTSREIKTYNNLPASISILSFDVNKGVALADPSKAILLNFDLNNLLSYACNQLNSYFKESPNSNQHNKGICDFIV
jgi:WD40 repeat protein